MGKLIIGKIDLTKVDQKKLFRGEKGIYLDLTIWQNDTPDKFGNNFSIEQRTTKDEDKIYIGNAKFYSPKKEGPTAKDEWKKSGKVDVSAMSDIDDLFK
jgi:hypothetical protein